MLPVFSKKTKIKIDRLHFSGEKKVGFRGFSGLWAGSLQGGGGAVKCYHLNCYTTVFCVAYH